MFNIDEIYTVSDFLSLCNKTIENNIPTCWLQGEISNLSRPASGHWYFSLKDSRGQIRCALFRLNQRNIKFNPENGMEILVRAAPTLYEARGDFQLIIQHVEPVGVGNLNLAFEQLKNKLKKEGLFDTIHKKSLPKEPKTIGVISSSNGAVIRDIVKVLHRRYPFAEVLLFDSMVQGEGSAERLATAVQMADESNRCDVLIIARGGGSLEDLWAFNEEIVARAIRQSQLPIVTGIGHETDFTIADFVADKRMATPSVAAEQVSPDSQELALKIHTLEKQILKLTTNRLSLFNTQITGLNHRIQQSDPRQQLSTQAQRLDELEIRLNNTLASMFNELQSKLMLKTTQLLTNNPSVGIRTRKHQNQLLSNRLNHAIKEQLTTKKYLLSHCSQTLNSLSPLATLNRGYALITGVETGELISSIKNLTIGDRINTRFSQGQIVSQIKEIKS